MPCGILLIALLHLLGAHQQSAPEQPLFSFAAMADVQYADQRDVGARHYRASLGLLQRAVADLNKRELAFVIQLGDLVDGGSENMETILGTWNKLAAPRHHVLGNHDFYASTGAVVRRLGMPAPWYSFTHDGWRFAVLDGLDLSLLGKPDEPRRQRARKCLAALGAKKCPNANPWNGGLGTQQMRWLDALLSSSDKARERVLVFCHLPALEGSAHASHLLWNHGELVALLEKHPCVAAYFSGHDHAGGYAARKGIHYVTLHGMVEAPRKNAYAIVDVYPDRLLLHGRGAVPSRTLVLRQLAPGQGRDPSRPGPARR